MKQQEQNKEIQVKGEKYTYTMQKKASVTGGQGQIYLAKDETNKRNVVIKSYFKQSSFEIDFQVMKKVTERRFEHLIQLYDHIKDDKNQYIVMELCNRGDLYSYLIKNNEPVETAEKALDVLDIAIQVAKGMVNLSKMQIAHRDLKPENILIHIENIDEHKLELNIKQKQPIKQKVIAKITDYGLCKDNDRLKSFVGTPNYMAPEIIQNFISDKSQLYDQSVDVWSFGLILFEMMTAKQLFYGSQQVNVFKKIKHFKLEDYDQSIIKNFKEIDDVIFKCINPNPKLRPSFEDILEQLEQCQQIIQNKIRRDQFEQIEQNQVEINQFNLLNQLNYQQQQNQIQQNNNIKITEEYESILVERCDQNNDHSIQSKIQNNQNIKNDEEKKNWTTNPFNQFDEDFNQDVEDDDDHEDNTIKNEITQQVQVVLQDEDQIQNKLFYNQHLPNQHYQQNQMHNNYTFNPQLNPQLNINLLSQQQLSFQNKFNFSLIQMRLIDKLKLKSTEVLMNLGFYQGISEIDDQKYKGIIITEDVIQGLTPLIIQIILKKLNTAELEKIKQVIQSTDFNKINYVNKINDKEKCLNLLDNILEFIQGFKINQKEIKNGILLNTIINLFDDYGQSFLFFMIVYIYIRKSLKQQDNQYSLERMDDLITKKVLVQLPCNIQLRFRSNYDHFTPNPLQNEIIITNSFISDKKYSILFPKSTLKSLF